jgi:hypothetical protein
MRTGIFALLSTVALMGCDNDDLPELGNIVLVITGDAAQTPSDMALNSRLIGLDYETRVIDEPSMTEEDVEDSEVGFVLISSSVRSSAPLDSISETPRPVVLTQVWVADDFGVTASDAKIRELNFATVPAEENLGNWTVTNSDHPAAGDTSTGVVSMWEVDQMTVTPMVDANDTATVIAQFDNSEFATLLVFDRGDELANGREAVQKRGLIAFSPLAPIRLTDQAWTLFDSTIRWAF